MGAMSCDPRSFDDLEKATWVQLAERDDTQASGDWAMTVIPMPVESGKQGARFVLGLGTAPPGLAQVTFDEHGSLTNQIGANALSTGLGPLSPLNTAGHVSALVKYNDTQFIASTPLRPITARFDIGLEHGTTILPETYGQVQAGSSLAVGHIDAAAGPLDIVVVGQLSLTIVSGGDPAKARTCQMKRPNVSAAIALAAQTVAVGKVRGTNNPFDQIVVAGRSLNGDQPLIQILDGTQVVNGQPCPETSSFTLSIAKTAPVAMAMYDFDNNDKLDLVAASIADTNVTGSANIVYFCPDITPTGYDSAKCKEIPSPSDENSSNQRGATLLIANIDNDASPELLIGDAAASVNNVSLAGQVLVYKFNVKDCATMRGPACLVAKLYDPSPSKNDYFGRALVATPFPKPDSTTNVLGIVEKNKLWVYFRVFSGSPDLRVP
jgi:hypothetical protein